MLKIICSIRLFLNGMISNLKVRKVMKAINENFSPELAEFVYGDINSIKAMTLMVFNARALLKMSLILPNDIIGKYMIGGKQVDVHYNPLVLSAYGAGTAATVPSSLSSICVYVDNTFLSIPSEYQMAILAHEVGHIACGHSGTVKPVTLENGKQMNVIDIEHSKYLNQEYEADRYSMSVGYNMYHALIYIRDNIVTPLSVLLEDDTPDPFDPINKRIAKLEGLTPSNNEATWSGCNQILGGLFG